MTTVLCVDDNPMSRYLVTAVIEHAGFQVLAAVDGEEGIEIALAQHPDLVLMDIELPGISGIDATKRLKAMAETSGIPVIALSGHEDRERIAEAMSAGCAGYVVKPLKMPVLLGTIHEVLGRGAA
jgi:CheY-like chemotaxis protein